MTQSASRIIDALHKKPGFTNYFADVHGSAFALSIAQASRAYKGLLIVLLPDAATTFPLKREIEYLLANDKNDGSLPVITLPDWETLP